jgi:hypothetical protein
VKDKLKHTPDLKNFLENWISTFVDKIKTRLLPQKIYFLGGIN